MAGSTAQEKLDSFSKKPLVSMETMLESFQVQDSADEGTVYVSHCGQTCTIGNGIIGSDMIECKVCGLTFVKVTSPHVNGGVVFKDDAIFMCERIWAQVKP